MNAKNSYTPNYAVIPGDILDEHREAASLTQEELANRLGLSKKHINRMIAGNEPITSETALKLEIVFGLPAHVWIGLESRYREFLAREAETKSLHTEAKWLKEIPHGVLPDVAQRCHERIHVDEAIGAEPGINAAAARLVAGRGEAEQIRGALRRAVREAAKRHRRLPLRLIDSRRGDIHRRASGVEVVIHPVGSGRHRGRSWYRQTQAQGQREGNGFESYVHGDSSFRTLVRVGCGSEL